MYCKINPNKKGGVYDMNNKKRLISRILDLLAMIENKRNQPIVNEIRALLRILEDD